MILFNSCVNENEVDLIGFELVVCVGYNLEVVIIFWQKMGRVSGGVSQFEFISIYFFDSLWMVNFQVVIFKVMLLYQQVRCGK